MPISMGAGKPKYIHMQDSGLNDPGRIKASLLVSNVARLMAKYGPGIELEFDAGHNNITVELFVPIMDEDIT